MVSWVLVMLITPVLFIAVAAVLIVIKSRQQTPTGPRCGNCGYNLTGSTMNRCPECGELFVDAGVITQPQPPRAKPAVTIALTISALVGLMTLFFGYGAMRKALVARPAAPTPATAPAAATQPAAQAQEQTP
jgi:hypothetical protein